MSEINNKVIEVLTEQLSVDAKKIKPESRFIEDLGADSLDIVELVMALEEKFDIEIPDEEAEKITTVNGVYEYIKNHTNS
jgi:acyl carrier protein